MGIWHVNDDGSGTWTRLDTNQVRFRGLRPSGPSAVEVIRRETYDDLTGELIATHNDWPKVKNVTEEPPDLDKGPRRLRTVFYFAATKSAFCPWSSSAIVGR